MDILIVFSTHDGQTEKIAHYLAARLRELGRRVDVMVATHPPAEVDLGRYRVVMIGAPVRMGKYPRAVVNFVRAHREPLSLMPSAFFSVCLAIASKNESDRRAAEELPERFFRATGWRPSHVATFAGALRYRSYNWLIRFIMKRIAKSEGASTDTTRNHEYTDWAAVTRFAEAISREAPVKARTAVAAVRD
jgi:menaquinone-dependent protoporphyrinogen oxidase